MPEDLRPPKEWFDKCVDETGNPRLCGWVFYHHLKPKKPEDKEKDKPETRAARARKRAWMSQQSIEVVPPEDYTPNEEKWQQALQQAREQYPDLDEEEILIKAVNIYTQNNLKEKIYTFKLKL